MVTMELCGESFSFGSLVLENRKSVNLVIEEERSTCGHIVWIGK
jgi:hypothetical protein